VSQYSERLAKLKKELALETLKRKKKKKKFTDNQTIMIKFINAVTDRAIFSIKGMRVVITRANLSHILKHYCSGCRGEIDLNDILNFDLYLNRAIQLANYGVSDSHKKVFQYIKGLTHYKIILEEVSANNYVVSFYSVD